MKKFILFLVLCSLLANAQHVDGEVELAGFILGQYRKAIRHQLGKPIETRITEDKWLYEFHKLKPDTSVYALFKYPVWDTTRVYAIQINGKRYDEMHSFRGLKLGAPFEAVTKVFGKSHDTETVDDPPVVVHYYEHKNYSVEIDKSGHLFGIQIYGKILNNKVNTKMASINGFRNAVISKNVDSLLHYLSPDVEIISGHKEIAITGAARDEFKKSTEFIHKLLGETNSVWYAFAKERAEGEAQLKTFGDSSDQFTVFKFYESEVISEMLFYPHAGRWKVFEIKFRH